MEDKKLEKKEEEKAEEVRLVFFSFSFIFLKDEYIMNIYIYIYTPLKIEIDHLE